MCRTFRDVVGHLGTIETFCRTFRDIIGHLGTIEKCCRMFRYALGHLETCGRLGTPHPSVVVNFTTEANLTKQGRYHLYGITIQVNTR